MLSLLLLVVFGLGMAFFATQNVATTTIILANHIYRGVPLYIVVIGSLLVGVFVSWIISMVNSLSATLAIHGRDKALQREIELNKELKRRLREAEYENASLSGHKREVVVKKEKRVHARPALA